MIWIINLDNYLVRIVENTQFNKDYQTDKCHISIYEIIFWEYKQFFIDAMACSNINLFSLLYLVRRITKRCKSMVPYDHAFS